MGTQKWDYRFRTFEQSDIVGMEQYSNLLGHAGWELIGVTNLPDQVVPNLEAAGYSDEAAILDHRILLTFKIQLANDAPLPPPQPPKES